MNIVQQFKYYNSNDYELIKRIRKQVIKLISFNKTTETQAKWIHLTHIHYRPPIWLDAYISIKPQKQI